jgi:hypothetical protein
MKYTIQADKTMNKIASGVPHNVVNRLYQGISVLSKYHMVSQYRYKCNFIYACKERDSYVLIFRKLINAHRVISYTKFHPNWTINIKVYLEIHLCL